MRTLSGALLLISLGLQTLDANGQSNRTIPRDFFAGITLDASVSGPFLSYTPIHFSGTVSDPLVSEIQFRFLYNDNEEIDQCGGADWYMVPVRDREFKHTLFFSHEQADEYVLQLNLMRGKPPLSSAGAFRPFTVQQAPEISPIPVDYFSDIELDSPIPVEMTTGQAVRVSATVFDPSLYMVKLLFYNSNGDFPMSHLAPVMDGRLDKPIFLPHNTAGVYKLGLERFHSGDTAQIRRDQFGPINVKEGEGTAFFPFDYFEEIELTSPMPVVYALGRKVRVTGTVSDPSVRQIDFLFFIHKSGQNSRGIVVFSSPVTNGEFSANIDFSLERGHRPGDSSLEVHLWRRGNSSLGPRRFRPITLIPPPSPDFNRDGTIGFADFVVFAEAFGASSADGKFDSGFDLDGDGTIGFSDFLIFAKAFGQPVGN